MDGQEAGEAVKKLRHMICVSLYNPKNKHNLQCDRSSTGRTDAASLTLGGNTGVC